MPFSDSAKTFQEVNPQRVASPPSPSAFFYQRSSIVPELESSNGIDALLAAHDYLGPLQAAGAQSATRTGALESSHSLLAKRPGPEMPQKRNRNLGRFNPMERPLKKNKRKLALELQAQVLARKPSQFNQQAVNALLVAAGRAVPTNGARYVVPKPNYTEFQRQPVQPTVAAAGPPVMEQRPGA